MLFVTPLTIVNINYEFYGSEFSTALALMLATTVGAIVSTFNKNFRHGLAFGVGICCLASVLFIIFSGSLMKLLGLFSYQVIQTRSRYIHYVHVLLFVCCTQKTFLDQYLLLQQSSMELSHYQIVFFWL